MKLFFKSIQLMCQENLTNCTQSELDGKLVYNDNGNNLETCTDCRLVMNTKLICTCNNKKTSKPTNINLNDIIINANGVLSWK